MPSTKPSTTDLTNSKADWVDVKSNCALEKILPKYFTSLDLIMFSKMLPIGGTMAISEINKKTHLSHFFFYSCAPSQSVS